jgi:hypothetical protein
VHGVTSVTSLSVLRTHLTLSYFLPLVLRSGRESKNKRVSCLPEITLEIKKQKRLLLENMGLPNYKFHDFLSLTLLHP